MSWLQETYVAYRIRSGGVVAGIVATLSLLAFLNHRSARRAEHRNPPMVRFIEVDGVRLHYIERGDGEPLILLHGNGSMVEDFVSSGLVDQAAKSYRVIAIDRPGYGHSTRPRDRTWTAEEQANLIGAALETLNVQRALVLGHSWGTLVAVALALQHPSSVKGLILASGYFYPTPRADVVVASVPAWPLVGAIVRQTLAPLVSRLLWRRLVRRIFDPAPVPAKFTSFPKEMVFRPSQLHASAAEAAAMIPTAMATSECYETLRRLPVSIIAGSDDKIADTTTQSARLHEDIEGSAFHLLPNVGHMVHQTSTDNVLQAIHQLSAKANSPEGRRLAQIE
jgi:pimeloyl-ACP methyl ester carboxylesterase